LSRENVPESAREEMDELLDMLMGFAVESLEKHGEFYPFAGVLSGGQGQFVAAATGDEHPASTELIEMLEAALRTHVAEGAQAAAIAADVSLDTGDAVRIHVEHVDGDAVDVFLPYAKKRLRGIDFGELFAAPADRMFFGD
jgi:hypothetical protein